MKAISLKPHSTDVALMDVREPQIEAADEIKVQVLEVGICGTDREEVAGGRADAPLGKQRLIIGHEMFGKVVEIGKTVNKVNVGDYGAFMVRRGCGQCPACKANRSDMCYTGQYTERGIKQADGYQAQFVVDQEKYFVKVPEEVR
ncbi:MAG TPA: alcohol dehydrogenase catalytic domain-containing protein, partial [Chitinophagaceae bacterium]|nr:alcohol dehydrogenase catalytic domain-containing protein [Chitinophagaceae bacterium]